MRSWVRAVAHRVLASYVGADGDGNVVAFTFDDGPDPECTPLVLDALRARAARATFFVLGDRAAAHPDLLRRAVSEGHEVGLHGFDHTGMFELSLPGRFRSLWRGRSALRGVTGTSPRWFRAPYGEQSPDTVAAGRVLGMRPVMWSTYAREWEDLSVQECAAFAASGLRAGAIVLLHDGFAGEGRGPRRPPREIVALLESLLDVAASRGLRVVPVGDLLAAGRPRRTPWFREWRVDAA